MHRGCRTGSCNVFYHLATYCCSLRVAALCAGAAGWWRSWWLGQNVYGAFGTCQNLVPGKLVAAYLPASFPSSQSSHLKALKQLYAIQCIWLMLYACCRRLGGCRPPASVLLLQRSIKARASWASLGVASPCSSVHESELSKPSSLGMCSVCTCFLALFRHHSNRPAREETIFRIAVVYVRRCKPAPIASTQINVSTPSAAGAMVQVCFASSLIQPSTLVPTSIIAQL